MEMYEGYRKETPTESRKRRNKNTENQHPNFTNSPNITSDSQRHYDTKPKRKKGVKIFVKASSKENSDSQSCSPVSSLASKLSRLSITDAQASSSGKLKQSPNTPKNKRILKNNYDFNRRTTKNGNSKQTTSKVKANFGNPKSSKQNSSSNSSFNTENSMEENLYVNKNSNINLSSCDDSDQAQQLLHVDHQKQGQLTLPHKNKLNNSLQSVNSSDTSSLGLGEFSAISSSNIEISMCPSDENQETTDVKDVKNTSNNSHSLTNPESTIYILNSHASSSLNSDNDNNYFEGFRASVSENTGRISPPIDTGETKQNIFESTAFKHSKIFAKKRTPVMLHTPKITKGGELMSEVLIYKLGSHSTPRKIRKSKHLNSVLKSNWGTPETSCFRTQNPSNFVSKRTVSNKTFINKKSVRIIPAALVNPVSADNIKTKSKLQSLKGKDESPEDAKAQVEQSQDKNKSEETFEVTSVEALIKKFENMATETLMEESKSKITIRKKRKLQDNWLKISNTMLKNAHVIECFSAGNENQPVQLDKKIETEQKKIEKKCEIKTSPIETPKLHVENTISREGKTEFPIIELDTRTESNYKDAEKEVQIGTSQIEAVQYGAEPSRTESEALRMENRMDKIHTNEQYSKISFEGTNLNIADETQTDIDYTLKNEFTEENTDIGNMNSPKKDNSEYKNLSDFEEDFEYLYCNQSTEQSQNNHRFSDLFESIHSNEIDEAPDNEESKEENNCLKDDRWFVNETDVSSDHKTKTTKSPSEPNVPSENNDGSYNRSYTSDISLSGNEENNAYINLDDSKEDVSVATLISMSKKISGKPMTYSEYRKEFFETIKIHKEKN